MNQGERFSHTIDTMISQPVNILCDEEHLILEKNAGKIKHSCNKQLFQIIFNYISHNKIFLKNKNLIKTEQIRNKLIKIFSPKKSLQIEISHLFDRLIAETQINPFGSQKNLSSPPIVLIKVASTAKNLDEFKTNVYLVINNYPRFQFGEDLAIYDTAFGNFPKKRNPQKVFAKLLKNFEHFFAPTEIELSKKNLRELVHLQKTCIQLMKPSIPVQMGVIIETSAIGTTNQAMLNHVKEFIIKEKPVIINRYLLKVHESSLSEIKVDFYIQIDGSLGVILPQGHRLENSGFSSTRLEKVAFDKAKSSILLTHHIVDDLKKILIHSNANGNFARLITFCGHGYHPVPYQNDSTGIIAGLPIAGFQQAIQKLNPTFLIVESCFVGGKNIHQIHFPDQTIRCPIVVRSLFETVTISTPHDRFATSFLQEVETLLFDSSLGPLPRQLRKKDIYRLMSSFPKQGLQNLPQILFPSKNKHIPKVSYPIFAKGEVVDLNKKEIPKGNARIYLFSKPVFEDILTVEGNSPIAFLSTGDTSQHLIKAINAPEIELEALADNTFNIWSKLKDSEPASKAFYIAKMTCKVYHESKIVFQILIKKLPNVREVIFRIEGEEDFRRIKFTKPKNAKDNWKKNHPDDSLNYAKALYEYYWTAMETKSSEQSLCAATLGRQGEGDFIDALKNMFWGDQELPEIDLFSSILQYPKLSSVSNVCYAYDSDKKKAILQEAFDLAKRLNKSFVAQKIAASSQTPLLKAVEKNDLQKVQEILTNHPQSVHEMNLNGSTALFFAAGKPNIGRLLIEKGAKIDCENRFKMTPLHQAVLQDDLDLVTLMLAKGLDVKGAGGGMALDLAIQNNKTKICEILLEQQAGIHSSRAILWSAARFSSPQYIFEQVLEYPEQLNFRSEPQKNTALHACVFLRDIERIKLLIEKNANPNLKNVGELSALHFAVLYGNEQAIEIIDLLLKQPVEIDSQSLAGNTPLHLAIKNKNTPLIKKLILAGASLTTENKDKVMAFDLISKDLEMRKILYSLDFNLSLPSYPPLLLQTLTKGDLELIKTFIQQGADLNQYYLGSPLVFHYLKSTQPHIQILQLCLEKLDLTQTDDQGNTILHLAMSFNPEILKMILDVNPTLNQRNHKDETPLMVLARSSTNVSMYRLMLDKVNDLEKDEINIIAKKLVQTDLSREFFHKFIFSRLTEKEMDAHPATSLHHAIFYQNIEKVEKWLQSFTATTSTDFFGIPPIQAVFYFAHDKQEILIPILLQQLSEWNKPDFLGQLPFQLALRKSPQLTIYMINRYENILDLSGMQGVCAYIASNDLVKSLLIEKKAGINKINSFLMQVIASKNIDHLKQIFETYPPFPIDPQNMLETSLLYNAFDSDDKDVVDLIFSKKPNPNFSFCFLGTPLHHLAKRGKNLQNQLYFTKQLLANHADIDSVDAQKNTPLHQAIAFENVSLAKFLIQNGACPHIQNASGQTAIDIAEEFWLFELVALMKEQN